MNPVLPARKRAEAFSALVEASSSGPLRHTDTAPPANGRHADLLPLVDVVTSLRRTPAVQARPEFVAELRGRLMAAAETALAPDTAHQLEVRRQPAGRRTSRERRLAAAIGGFALVSASASMSVAAQTALPGDTLYPLKRALENVHADVLRSPDDKGTTILDNASGRLDEVDRLTRAGSQDPDVIAATLDDFTAQAVEASGILLTDFEETGRVSSIEELRTFVASSLEALDRLEAVVPAGARDSLVEAARVLDQIDRKAIAACPSCSDLPPAVDPVATAAPASGIGPLYEHLLDTAAALAPTRVGPVGPDPAGPSRPPSQPGGASTPSVEPPGAPAPTPAQPAQPGLPTNEGGGPTTSDPLEPLTTGADSTGLGDLLTGAGDSTGEVVDETVGGVVPGLGDAVDP